MYEARVAVLLVGVFVLRFVVLRWRPWRIITRRFHA
jgi:hypothetical protein